MALCAEKYFLAELNDTTGKVPGGKWAMVDT
jgi:hypothetical protein